MTKRIHNLALLLVTLPLAVAVTACRASKDEESKPHSEDATHSESHEDNPGGGESDHAESGKVEGEAGAIALTPDDLAREQIEVAVAGPGTIDSGIELVGEILPNGDRLAHITPRFPGIVREVLKQAGDHVRAGDVLAVIESSESLSAYSLKTAIDGIVLAKHLTRGEAVDREKQAFIVADLRSVWADLAVYQKDLVQIPVGQRVHVQAVGGGPSAEGAIVYITPDLNQTTRTATARVVLDNKDGRFRPGMFVSARTLDPAEGAVVVPREAIQTWEGGLAVFVETQAGWTPRPVVLGRQGDLRAEVIAGLTAGERILAKNSFLLKAELGKAEAEHDH